MPNTIPCIEVDVAFTYHAPKDGQVEKYQAIRDKAKELGHLIIELCPGKPDHGRAIAIERLRECVMWANASIAVNESLEEVEVEKL